MISATKEIKKKLFSPQSPSRGGTHYVIEIFNSFFFKLDTSSYTPFVLCCLDSLSTAVLLTMNDPEALVPWEVREHMCCLTLFVFSILTPSVTCGTSFA